MGVLTKKGDNDESDGNIASCLFIASVLSFFFFGSLSLCRQCIIQQGEEKICRKRRKTNRQGSNFAAERIKWQETT
jgi:hypothetical protein